MKTKINFKSGFISGCILGILILISGHYVVNKISEKAANIAELDIYELEYRDMNGNSVDLSSLEGKNVLVNFWATWCGPCVKEFPVLQESYELLKDDFVFVVVSDESFEKIDKFRGLNPYEFTYLKTDRLMFQGITTVPQTFVFDASGKKRKHHPTIFYGSPAEITEDLRSWVKNES